MIPLLSTLDALSGQQPNPTQPIGKTNPTQPIPKEKQSKVAPLNCTWGQWDKMKLSKRNWQLPGEVT